MHGVRQVTHEVRHVMHRVRQVMHGVHMCAPLMRTCAPLIRTCAPLLHLWTLAGESSEKRPWAAEKRQATLGWAKQGSRVPVTNPRFARAWPIRKSDSVRTAPCPLGKNEDAPRR